MVRIKIAFEVARGSVLPLNNKYETSAWIYKVLSKADSAFADWLHDIGYAAQQGIQAYKLFTFSTLMPKPYKIIRDQGVMVCTGNQVELTVSFYGNEAVQNFIAGLFKDQVFDLGTKRLKAVRLKVAQVNILPKPTFKPTQRFRATSPVCFGIKTMWKGKESEKYIAPTHPEYEHILTKHLTNKLVALSPHFPQLLQSIDLKQGIQWRLTSPKIRKKKITMKSYTHSETDLIGYQHDFEITAPPPILEILYFGGLGKATSQGFGFVEVMD